MHVDLDIVDIVELVTLFKTLSSLYIRVPVGFWLTSGVTGGLSLIRGVSGGFFLIGGVYGGFLLAGDVP